MSPVHLFVLQTDLTSGGAGAGSVDENGLFLEYVGKSYQHFLSGNDPVCEALDLELERSFEQRGGHIGQEVDR